MSLPNKTLLSFLAGNMEHLSKRYPPRKAAPRPYKIVAQLPERNEQLQYRIKSGCEHFYRTVKEDELAPEDFPASELSELL